MCFVCTRGSVLRLRIFCFVQVVQLPTWRPWGVRQAFTAGVLRRYKRAGLALAGPFDALRAVAPGFGPLRAVTP